MIHNDQTPSKYIQVGRFSIVPQGAKKAGVARVADKRMITLTLTVTTDGETSAFSAIYDGKAKQFLPKINFPTGFSLSANIKHQ